MRIAKYLNFTKCTIMAATSCMGFLGSCTNVAKTNCMYSEAEESFDPVKLESLLINAAKSLEEAKGKDLVLILGNTGAGKSTIVNYLQGHEFSFLEDSETGDKCLIQHISEEMNGIRSPKMSDHTDSCTTYPDFYPCNKDLYVCDTAGFGDTGGSTKSVFAYLAVKMAIKAARSVKAVIVLVEESNLDASRSRGFKELIQVMDSMFHGPEYMPSAFLAFNKVTKSKNQLINTMKVMEEKFSKSMSNAIAKGDITAAREFDTMGRFLHIFNESGNVLRLNPTDSKGKDELINILSNSKPIPSSALGCAIDTKNESELCNTLGRMAIDGTQRIKNISETIKNLDLEHKRLHQEHKDIEENLNKIAEYTELIQTEEKLDFYENVRPKKEVVDEKKQEFKDMEKKVEILEYEIKDLKQKIFNRETCTEEVEIDRQVWSESTTFPGGVKQGVINHHRFETNCQDDIILRLEYQFLCDSATGEPAKFANKCVSSYRASIDYYTPSDVYGLAATYTYARVKDTFLCKQKVKKLSDELKDQEERLNTAKQDLESRRKAYNTANESYVNQRVVTKNNLIEMRQQCVAAIQKSKDDIEKIKTKIESWKENCNEDQKYIISNEQRFKMLFSIYDLMGITNRLEVVPEFRQLYTDFAKTVDSYLDIATCVSVAMNKLDSMDVPNFEN